ncbi:MAG: PhzF family phenazine biosynthesis protein [Alphaproteobacteria bacterium]
MPAYTCGAAVKSAPRLKESDTHERTGCCRFAAAGRAARRTDAGQAGSAGLTDPEATAWIGAPVKGAAQAVDVGPVWLIAELESIADLEGLQHDEARLAAYYVPKGWTGATLYAADSDRVVVRSFAPGDGIAEDPVCGSGNGAAAAFRLAAGQIGAGDSYVASQGRQVGRDGFITIRIAGQDIHVGGQCVTCITGSVML